MKSGQADVKTRAEMQHKRQAKGGLPKSYPNPVQVVRIGDDFVLAAIGQEVVVDYSLRLKRELAGPAAVWVAGYSNDVFGYLPSLRIIREGGYEAVSANTRILNHPGRFADDAEERVIGKVHELLGKLDSP